MATVHRCLVGLYLILGSGGLLLHPIKTYKKTWSINANCQTFSKFKAKCNFHLILRLHFLMNVYCWSLFCWLKRNVCVFLGFLYLWGIIFFITTTLVMILKHESNSMLQNDRDNQSVVSAYHQLWKIVQLPSVLSLIFVLLTIKVFVCRK